MCCFRKLSNFFAGLVFILLIIAAVGWWYLAPRMDGLLSDAIRREFMLDADSEVRVQRGSLLDTLEGQVDGITINSAQARLNDLVVEDLVLIARGVTFDMPSTFMTGRAELAEVSEGEISFNVPEQALADRWGGELERHGFSNLAVDLDKDEITVSGRWGKPITVKVEATGSLKVSGTEKIKFVPDDINVGGLETGMGKLLDAFGGVAPVVDLSRMQKLMIVIDQVAIEEGYISVRARSLSLAEKLDIEQEREKEGDNNWKDMKLKLPTLEEAMEAVTGLFVETGSEATEGNGQANAGEEQEGSDGGNGTD